MKNYPNATDELVLQFDAARMFLAEEEEEEEEASIVVSLKDITERVQAQESLQESEERYRTTFESTGTATVIVEEDTTISLANTEFSKLCGYSREEVEGKKSWTEFVAKDDLERMKEYHRLRRIADKAAPGNYEFRFIDRWGNARNIFLTIAMIPGTQKSVASLLDITERVRSEETLRALNTAAAVVQRAARTPEAVFAAVMEQLHDVGLNGAVALLDETRERFTIRYTAITSQVLAQTEKLVGLQAKGYILPVEQLPIGGQILAGKTVFVPDVAALMAPIVPAPVRPLMPSAMRLLEMPRGVVAPLSVEGEIIGFLGVSADHMTEANVPVVTAFANQMAAALENAHLFQAEQRGRQVAEAMQEVGRVVNTSLDLDNVLPLILEQLAQVIQYDSSAVLLFVDDRLEMRAGRGFPNIEAALRLSFAADEDNLPSAVMRSRRSLVIGDVESDPRWQSDPEVNHIRGWMGAPLIVRDRVVGVLTVDSRQPEAYSQEDGQLVFAFADQAAVAIQNAQLYNQAQREIAERVRAEQELEERRVYLEGVLGATPNAIVTLDENHLIVYWNPGAEILFGYSPEEVIGKNVDHLITNPDTYENATGITKIILGGKKVSPTEAVRYRKDGSLVDVIVAGSPILVGDELIGVVAVYTDITERKLAEEQIQRRNRELALLNRVIAAASTTLEPKAVLETTCRELALAFDLPQAAAALLNEARTASVVVAEYLEEGYPSAMDMVIPLESNPATQYILKHKSPLAVTDVQHDPRMITIHNLMRRRGTVSMFILPLMARGQVVGTLGLDAVERREFSNDEIDLAASAAAAASQALENARLFDEIVARNAELRRLSQAIEQTAEAVVITDLRGEIEYVNPAFEHITGYSQDEALGQNLRILNSGEHDEAFFREMWQTILAGEVWRGSLTNQRKSGEIYHEEMTITPVYDESGAVVNFVAIKHDVTDRVQAEAALRESEQKYRIMIEQSNDMIWTLDIDGNFTFFNQRTEELSGYRSDDWQGKSFVPLIEEKDLPLVMDVFHRILKGEPQQYEVGVKKQDGGTLTLSVNTAPILKADQVIGTVSFGRDITKRKQAEEKIQRQMAFLGALHTIDMTISASMDLTLTIDVILDQTLSQLNVDAADILLFDPALQTLECAGRQGFKTTALQYTNLRLGQGLAGQVALQQEIKFIPDLKEEEEAFLASPELSGEAFSVYYGIPLIAKGVLKGVLEIFHRAPLSSDDEWLMFLNALAGQAAIAIDNAVMFTDLQRSNLELGLAYDSTLEGWAKALELKDMETEGHSRRVVDLTMKLASQMGVSRKELVHIRRGALLHDIGKMGIPDSILQKPGLLTDEEWQIMRKHPVYAFEWLSAIEYLRPALNIPYSHHERWDGSGYPQGLRGEEIPLPARIFAIVDVWDALNSDRPYREAWSQEKALEYIGSQAGAHFDPKVVEVFLNVFEQEKTLDAFHVFER